MRTIFAFQCDLTPAAGQDPRALFEALFADGTAWMRDRVRCQDGTPATEEDGCRLLSERKAADGEECALTLYHRPDNDDPTVSWLSCFGVALHGREVTLAVWTNLVPARFEVRPGPLQVAGHPLVALLVTKYRCQVNGQPVPLVPRQLVASDVHRFARNSLLSPRRSLAVLMLTPPPLGGTSRFDAVAMQERMLGFAEVVSLADADAAARLAAEIGQPLAPPPGGARLYWPGLHADDDPARHPFRTLESLEKVKDEAVDLGVAALLVQAAVDRFNPLRFGLAAWLDPDDARRRARANAELERLRAEVERLRRQHAAMSSELANTRVELASCRDALARAAASAPKKRPAGKASADHLDVATALARAGEEHADVLVIWESAEQSAAKSESSHGGAVLRALGAIAEVARALFRDGPDALGPLDKALAARVPFKYTSHESTTTLGLFGQHRVFHHNGRSQQMERHLTLSRGDRKNCVQIYFEIDHAARRAHVGYCGKHLPIAQRPT